MILKPNEYTTTEDSITIKKKALEEWRDNYNNTAKNADLELAMKMYYTGRADALLAILEHFEKDIVQ